MRTRIKENLVSLRKDVSFLKPIRFIDRAHPLEIFFVLAIILCIIGLVISSLREFILVGGFVIVLYIIFLIIYIRTNT